MHNEVLLLPASNYICIRATPTTIIYHFWGWQSTALCYIFYPIKNPTAALEMFVLAYTISLKSFQEI